jgi:hypothetical protein
MPRWTHKVHRRSSSSSDALLHTDSCRPVAPWLRPRLDLNRLQALLSKSERVLPNVRCSVGGLSKFPSLAVDSCLNPNELMWRSAEQKEARAGVSKANGHEPFNSGRQASPMTRKKYCSRGTHAGQGPTGHG